MQEIVVGLFSLAFCLVLLPAGLFAIGYRFGKRAGPGSDSSPPAVPTGAGTTQPRDRDEHIRWLLRELQREPITSALSATQRERLMQEYRAQLPVEAPTPGWRSPVAPEPRPTPPPAPVVMDQPRARQETAPSTPVLQPLPATGEPVVHGRELDPAVMLLYVGALMIVAAGLIYAAYNWADFSAWQKLGALAAATIAFIGAGFSFHRSDRLAPAANTFLSIGALLVPANALAAWAVLDCAQSQPALPLFFGALATAIVHGAFSIRPGGRLYDYGAVVATAIAALALPTAMGADFRWGAPLALALLAGFPALAGPLDRLNQPRLLVMILASPVIASAVVSGFTGDANARWVAVATLAVTTWALLRLPGFAPGLRVPAEIGATVTALAIIPAVLNALDVLDAAALREFGLGAVDHWTTGSLGAWGVVALLAAIGWTAALVRIPRLRPSHFAAALTAEAGALFMSSYALFSHGGFHVAALGATLAGVIAMTLVARLRDWRWLLLASAGFLLFAWGTISFATGLDGASPTAQIHFAALYPVAMLAGALAVLRWWRPGTRQTAAFPVWLVTLASAGFVAFSAVVMTIDQPSTAVPMLLVLLGMGAVALLTAHFMASPLVLAGYGAILTAIVALAIDRWTPSGFVLPAMTAAATFTMAVSVLLAQRATDAPGLPLRLFDRPRPRLEIAPILGLVLFTLLGVIIASIGSIVVTYSRPEGHPLELATSSWLAHLGVLALVVAGSLWSGPRLRDTEVDTPVGRALQSGYRALTLAPVLIGLVIVAGVTSMVTRDAIHASQVAMIVAAGMAALWVWWTPGEGFRKDVRTTFSYGWPIALATGVLWNLDLASVSLAAGQLVPQIAVHGAVATLFGAIAIARRSSNLVYVTATLLTSGCWFGTRFTDTWSTAALMCFIVLAWMLAATGIVAHARARLRWAAVPLMTSAIAIGAVSILPTLPGVKDVPDLDLARLQGLVTIWLVSLTGLLAVSGWTWRRRDLSYLASGLAMLALLIQVNARSPENIHAYTVPLAAWLFALGWIERRNAGAANPLFGAGAGLLVAPGMLHALASGEVRWLIILLLEGLALFLAGVFLRLRVPLAAGVVTISVLVLRMLVDMANALPNWMTLLGVGLVLLAGGTIWISFRDDVRRRMDAFSSNWGRLR